MKNETATEIEEREKEKDEVKERNDGQSKLEVMEATTDHKKESKESSEGNGVSICDVTKGGDATNTGESETATSTEETDDTTELEDSSEVTNSEDNKVDKKQSETSEMDVSKGGDVIDTEDSGHEKTNNESEVTKSVESDGSKVDRTENNVMKGGDVMDTKDSGHEKTNDESEVTKSAESDGSKVDGTENNVMKGGDIMDTKDSEHEKIKNESKSDGRKAEGSVEEVDGMKSSGRKSVKGGGENNEAMKVVEPEDIEVEKIATVKKGKGCSKMISINNTASYGTRESRILNCLLCNKAFFLPSSLKLHYCHAHPGKPPMNISAWETTESHEHSPDTSVVTMTQTTLKVRDMPTCRHNETRGQFMCRLELAMKNRTTMTLFALDTTSDTSDPEPDPFQDNDEADFSDVLTEEESVM